MKGRKWRLRLASFTVVEIELRGLGYQQRTELVRGHIEVQGTNTRVRRVAGSGVIPSVVSGEATVSFDLLAPTKGYLDAPVGTIRIADPAAGVDITVEVEMALCAAVDGVAYPDDVGSRK
jgi:hypothetical protein